MAASYFINSDMKFIYLALVTALLGVVLAQRTISKARQTSRPAAIPKVPEGAEVITLGAGLASGDAGAVFQQIPGVLSVTAGYMGGTIRNPTYEQVCSGTTGHTEVSRVVFDPKQTSLEKILEAFWTAHHPTEPNSSSARSVISYTPTTSQRQIAERSKAMAASSFSKPIVTEIARAGEFYAAEEYHQDYYGIKKHGNTSCAIPIPSKLEAFWSHVYCGLKK